MANRIQLRRDTTANWANVNPILSDGEMGYDIVTNEIRIGDGSTAWTGLSGNVIGGGGGGGGGASTGDVTFNGINIIGDDNLRFQPNTTVTDGYVDIYLTTGPDIHIDHSGGNLILGPDNWANVRLATEGNVQIRAQDGNFTSTWTFNPDGNLVFPDNKLTISSHTIIGDGVPGNEATGLHLAPSMASVASGHYLRVRGEEECPIDPTHLHLDTSDNANINFIIGSDSKHVMLANTGNVKIQTTGGNWAFDTQGVLTLPASTSNVMIDASNVGIQTIAQNGTVTFHEFSGEILVNAIDNGSMYKYLVGGSKVWIMGSTSPSWTPSSSAPTEYAEITGQANIAYVPGSPSGSYVFTNLSSSNTHFNIVAIKTRNYA
jgi:hypothetical protein